MESLTQLNVERTAAVALAAVASTYLVERALAILVFPRFEQLRQLPGPPTPNALLGFFAYLEDPAIGTRLDEWTAAHGDTYAMAGPFGSNILVTRDPRALQYATVTRAEGWGPHWFIAKYFRNSFGKGLITALGAEHHKQRRVLSPAFGEAHVRALAPTFRALAAVVLPKWTEATAQGPVELDVYDWANRYTIDGIGLGGFGHNFESLDPPAAGSSALSKAFRDLLGLTMGTPMSYAETALPLLKALPTSRRRTIVQSKTFIKKAVDDMIQERKLLGADEVNLVSDVKDRKDILTVLVRANSAPEIKPEERLSDEVVAENVGLFLAAGHETTANTLAFALWRLALEPVVQDKLRAELRECPQLAPDAPADECTFQALASLPYLDGVVNEMFRLYAAVPFAWRTAHEDHVVPLASPVRACNGKLLDAVLMRKGDMMIIPSNNLKAEVWGENPLALKPEMWASLDDVQKAEPGWSHISTFGYGGKSCIGQRFAALELKVFIATIVREFVLSSGPRTADVEPRMKTLMKPYLKGDDSGPQLPLLITRCEA